MKKSLLSLLLISLSSCALPDPFDRDNCRYYGVCEGKPIGPVREELEMPAHVIQGICRNRTQKTLAGCIQANSDGTTTIFYQQGDKYTRNHERAHSICGYIHTGRYYRDTL